MSSSRNCTIQNEEEDMEDKADKDKDKINQSEQKQEKNVSKLYTGNLNPNIKENDLEELFGLINHQIIKRKFLSQYVNE